MRDLNAKSGPCQLREMLKKPEIIVAPGCYDVLSARLVEQAGFKAAFMTGTARPAHSLAARLRTDDHE
jgi:2-methylisocitrate lyase-like PEP mutase family enzyme